MLHDKAATLNTGERLESPIEHQRKRRLRGIEIGKRMLNGNATAAEQVVGKIARQVNTRSAQGRNGIQCKPRRGLGRKLLNRMTGANGNNTGGRAAQRGNVRGALAGTTKIASERTNVGALAYRKRHGPDARIALAAHGDQVGGIDLDGARGQLNRIALASTLIGANAIDRDGRKSRRHLHLRAKHSGQLLTGVSEIVQLGGNGHRADGLALRVIGAGLDAKRNVGDITFGIEG